MERDALLQRLRALDKYPGLLIDPDDYDNIIQLALDELNSNTGGKFVEGEYGSLVARYPDAKIVRVYSYACAPAYLGRESNLFYTTEDDGVFDCGGGGSWAVATIPFTVENIDTDSFMYGVFFDYLKAAYHEVVASKVFASKGIPERPFDLATDELHELADKYRDRARQKLEEQWIYKFV